MEFFHLKFIHLNALDLR